MTSKCTGVGMRNILDGVMRYRSKLRGELLNKFEMISQNPQPKAILFTCIDSRILLSRIIQANPGETFIVRNPGNLIPNYNLINPNKRGSEEAALELACIHNKIDTVVLSGHSDCKAMNLVHDNRHKLNETPKNEQESVLKNWLVNNSKPTIEKFIELEKNNFKKPAILSITDNIKFEAYIDPKNEFPANDKFSQLNALVQLENLKYYPFMKEPLEKRLVNAYILWLDINYGDVYAFSYKDKCFLKLDDTNYDRLLTTVKLD